MKVGITGANGFLGSNLSKFLKKKNFKVREIQRKYQINTFQLNTINSCTNWDEALQDIDILIHCAGNAHKVNLSKKNVCNFSETSTAEPTLCKPTYADPNNAV